MSYAGSDSLAGTSNGRRGRITRTGRNCRGPCDTAAPKIDTGDTAWMIVATALVMLMSIPGLALFYGGLSKTKDTLNTMAMTFVTFCIVSVLWVLYGYTFAFGEDVRGIIGSASKLFLKGVGPNSISDLAKTIPEYIFIAYQLTFAAITVALASGAYIERMKFSAWIIFSVLWVTIVYLPVAHWVWGGRLPGKARTHLTSPAGRSCTSTRVSRRSWARLSSASGAPRRSSRAT